MASIGDAAAEAAVLDDIPHAINPAVRDDYDAHDRAMSSAIAAASATPWHSNAPADTATTPTDSMTMFAEIVARGNAAILAQICMENIIHRATAKATHEALLSHINMAITATDHHEEEL
jgi:hypothetical protein